MTDGGEGGERPGSGSAHRPYVPARTRVLTAAALGLAIGAASALALRWQVAVLIGWSAGAVFYVLSAVVRLHGLDAAETEAHATTEDGSRAISDLLVVSGAVASLVAIGLALLEASSTEGAQKAVMVGLAVLAVASAWGVVHTAFTLRYAHRYYSDHGGIDFNSEGPPDYHDFAYLGLTVGMTFQVSDTDITTRGMRRTVTRHALVSFLLGAVVIAVSINVVASLLNG